jgi:hypothetical protein
MACNDWEESALLYSSGELDEGTKVQFESHIAQCESCKEFLKQYQKDQESLFSIQMLGETPSERIDREITRVCENGKKQYTNVGFFSVFAKKTVISASFFLIGFFVVGYLMLNLQQSKVAKNNTLQNETQLSPSPVSKIDVAEISKNTPDSTMKDSAISDPADSNRFFSKNRGNLEATGVVPVDLTTK